MTKTIIEQLAEFTTQTTFDQLPPDVVNECKRAMLDSIGVAVAGLDHPKGISGVDYGRMVGGGNGQATIIGTGERMSVVGAAFANAELINALDMCNVTPPGHVTPYVFPGAMAVGETLGSSGKELIVALAVAHEISIRFGKTLANQRDTSGGKVIPVKVFGNSSGIFGATAAIGRMKGYSTTMLAHALGIAAYISPVNSQVSWFKHLPSSTVKYIYAGMLVQQALTSAFSAEVGHTGDWQVLDDAEYGYSVFISSPKWEPVHLTQNLGSEWRFPAGTSYKPYPHCRVPQTAFDCVVQIVKENNLKPNEIESIDAFVEAIANQPVWYNRKIDCVQDAQFSMAHGIATAAHLFPLGKIWQAPETVFSDSVMGLMSRVTVGADPDFGKLLEEDPASRPARVEIHARGQKFVAQKRYPKGSPTVDPSTFMTNEELIQKFRNNCAGVLPQANIDQIVHDVMNLENVSNIAAIARLMGPAIAAPASVAAE
jgi:2-methylcitrate dehydratase PrpD